MNTSVQTCWNNLPHNTHTLTVLANGTPPLITVPSSPYAVSQALSQ